MTDAPTPTVDRGFSYLDHGRSVRIETPEHVRIGFELAGPGSRSAAMVVDLLLISAIALGIILALTGIEFLTGNEVITNIGFALGTIAVFLLQWGYFFLFEAFRDGRTFGKARVGLRVIGQEGTPVTIQAAALRNLLRIVDLQPAMSGLIGFGFMAAHPRSQRLGDIVAGTVVVRDRGDHAIPEERAAELPRHRALLDPERFAVLERFVERRESLDPQVRVRVRGRVAKAMGEVLARDPRRMQMPLEDLLVDLYEVEKPLQGYSQNTSPQAVQLVREKRGTWARTAELLEKASGGKGLRSLTEDELEEFTRLYREVVADLARAHTYGGSLRLCFHLERLAGEAHNLFYRDRERDFSFWHWLRVGFPIQFRRRAAFVGTAAFLLFAPAITTYVGVRADPELGRRFTPPQMVTRAEEAGDRLARGEQYIDVPQVQMSLFSSQLMTNNIQVAFLSAAGGILAGLGTVLILILNGVHLGSVFGLYDAFGAASLLGIFVAPHGVIELTAIVISGGAGLMLARAIVAPGRRSRAKALREEGLEALSLVGGAAVLLVIAGLVEGFVSPAVIPTPFKLGFAGLLALLLYSYLGTAGRRAEPASE